MTTLKKTLFFVLILFVCKASAQNMQEGFTYLEQGKFDRAETFFENILKEYPTNKTAKLCYARALGLNGNPGQAKNLFMQMLNDYPGDFEIELNYAESLLWNKNYEAAKTYYGTLVAKQPESFPALLGYANTFSNLKEYPEALEYVNKALEVSPGNANAMTSRKYIRLGYAYTLTQQQQYTAALEMLDQNLIDFPADKDTLLNKANIYLIIKQGQKAKQAYFEMAKTLADSITAINGAALAEHIDHKEKKALQWSELAVSKASVLNDSLLLKSATERYIQALIWNKQYKNAERAINALATQYPDDSSVMAIWATLGMYRSDFNQSVTNYTRILQKDTTSFDGNLGIANAYFAQGKHDSAYVAVDRTLKIFENQKDAVTFLNKLHNTYSPSIEEHAGYSYDNGKNKAWFTGITVNLPASLRWSFSAMYKHRETKNETTGRAANSNDYAMGTSYKLHPLASFNVVLGTTHVTSSITNYTQVLAQAFIKTKPFKLQDAELGYKRDIQNFNADLVNREITADNIYLNYNVGSNVNLGWFTQYYYTSQSDGNKRNLLFTSLYYNFLSRPVLKGGINYQYIAFNERRAEVYFSPLRFNLVEVFTDFLRDENGIDGKGVFYNVNAAGGYQFIEDNKKQGTYRFQGKIGYKFSGRFVASAYALHSNIASTTAAGFTYTELGIRLKWVITSKPVFYKQNI
ncbi:tetratricopeptide repeat protein [Flavobacterium rhizosphaerae]|uniref:Tetratricopeptide repeat protein n=1 Tax=Flavobacterium rhizosphaerae TaxID=3163298 RepID=A0ABW8YWD7_9FLAO